MTIDGLITNAGGQTSVAVVLAGALVSVVLIMARRAAAAVARLEGSVRRLGERIGTAETDLSGEVIRRRQLEQSLREHAIRLPYWPGDPLELYRPPATDQDDAPETEWMPTQDFSRHRLPRRTP